MRYKILGCILAALLFSLILKPSTASAEPVSFWIANLRNPILLIRKTAAANLGNIRDARALEPLIETLADPEAEVRVAAIGALRKLADLRAIGPLIQTSKQDQDYYVRHFAAVTINQIKQFHEKQDEKKRKAGPEEDMED